MGLKAKRGLPLAATYAVLGREEEARTEVSEILRIEPGFSIKKYKKFMFLKLALSPKLRVFVRQVCQNSKRKDMHPLTQASF